MNIKPKAPKSKRWQYGGESHNAKENVTAEVYLNTLSTLSVLSSVVPAGDNGELYYHVSVRRVGYPCREKDIKIVLRDFDMRDAERHATDPRHHAAHFFLPVKTVLEA